MISRRFEWFLAIKAQTNPKEAMPLRRYLKKAKEASKKERLAGVSIRNYRKALPQFAGTAGLSKSSVSREFIEASAEELKQLREKHLEDLELLVIELDGMVFAEHPVIAAVGVDRKGCPYWG